MALQHAEVDQRQHEDEYRAEVQRAGSFYHEELGIEQVGHEVRKSLVAEVLRIDGSHGLHVREIDQSEQLHTADEGQYVHKRGLDLGRIDLQEEVLERIQL